jgi:hypothetical protein
MELVQQELIASMWYPAKIGCLHVAHPTNTALLVGHASSVAACRSGGAVSLTGPADALMIGCELSGNRAGGNGGAFALMGAHGNVTLRLINTTINGNAAQVGQDVYKGQNSTTMLGGKGGTPAQAIQESGEDGKALPPRVVSEEEAIGTLRQERFRGGLYPLGLSGQEPWVARANEVGLVTCAVHSCVEPCFWRHSCFLEALCPPFVGCRCSCRYSRHLLVRITDIDSSSPLRCKKRGLCCTL